MNVSQGITLLQADKKDTPRVIMSLRIRPDLKEKIAELARQDRRTVSAYIELVLEDHLGSEKRSKKK
jgi:hypothetical protein